MFQKRQNFLFDDINQNEFVKYELKKSDCDTNMFFWCRFSLRCIPRNWVMDGIADCSSGEDESNLLLCNVDTEFKCQDNGRCIARRFVNDGYFDCADRSDEVPQERTTLDRCNRLEFQCSEKRCIPRHWVRNGIEDCLYGEDETPFEIDELMMSQCNSDEFGCSNGERCLPLKYKCDGKKHCSDGSDEIDLCEVPQMYPCPHNFNRLVPWSVVREYFVSKDDNFLELLKEFCDPHLEELHYFEFDVTLLYPIKCRKIFQVFEGSTNELITVDPENLCKVHSNKTEQISLCLDGSKVLKDNICDNKIDCFDLSDECTCEKHFYDNKMKTLCDQFYSNKTFEKYNSENISLIHDLYLVCNEKLDSKIINDEIFCGEKSFLNEIDESEFEFPNGTSYLSIHECARGKSSKSYNETFLKIESNKVCNDNVDCVFKDDECSNFCLDTILRLTENISMSFNSTDILKLPMITNCFPFIEPISKLQLEKMSYSSVYNTHRIFMLLGEPVILGKYNSFVNNDGFETVLKPKKNQENEMWCELINVLFLNIVSNKLIFYNAFLIQNENISTCVDRYKLSLFDELNEFFDMNFLCDLNGVSCPWLHKCSSKTKINIKKVCDLTVDCEDLSDEQNCLEDTHHYCETPSSFFIPRNLVGDEVYDCIDSSDECKETDYSSQFEMIKNQGLRRFIWFSGFGIVLANLFAIYTNLQKLSKITSKSSLSFFNTVGLLNLHCSDVIYGVALLTLGVKSYTYSGRYCEIDLQWRSSKTCLSLGIATLTSSLASLNFLVILTAVRLLVTKNPFLSNDLQKKYLFITFTFAWISPLLVSLVPVFFEWSFVSKVLVEANKFLNDVVLNKTALEDYITRTEHIGVVLGKVGKDDLTKLFSWSSFSSWFVSNNEISFPDRQVKLISKFGFYSNSSVCFPNIYAKDEAGSLFSLIVVSYALISFLFIFIGYYLIYKEATQSKKIFKNTNENNVSKKMFRKIMYIIATDAACWFPCIITTIASYNDAEIPSILPPLSAIVFLPINSFLNPILYTDVHNVVYESLKDLHSKISLKIDCSNKKPAVDNLSNTASNTATKLTSITTISK